MQINEVTYDAGTPIDGYGPDFIRLGGSVIEGAVLVAPDGARGWAGYEAAGDILALTGKIDVLLVGTGAEMTYLPPAFREKLEAAGIGVEAMATPSACRTYNVLLGEGRRIAAALLPAGA